MFFDTTNRSIISLLYFLWISNNKVIKIDYSKEEINESGNKVIIFKDVIKENLLNFLKNNKLIKPEKEEIIINKIQNNALFLYRIDELEEIFNSIGNIVEVNFTDKNLNHNAEQVKINENTVRYEKSLKFSKIIILIDILIKQNTQKYYNILYNWLMGFINKKDYHSNDIESLLTLYLEMNNERKNFLVQEDTIYFQYKKKNNIPHQRIYFGAPGTGKSYLLNEEAKNLVDKYERVTFHPNYMYGNFIGTFKPFPKKIDNKEEITYKYVPGVLLRLLIEALKNPEGKYMLVIEEINRANTAGVFGDFFQLLDRNEKGESQYPISTSEELREYLREEFGEENTIKAKLGNNYEKIYLPTNLYIWATMNSSDQGIMPLDTAFKRRWNFKYIGIDEGEEEIKNKYHFKVAEKRYLWNEFRKKLNEELLKNCNVPEDKLLGPYFIDKATLDSSSEEELMEVIKDKVLMYLYEDIGKMYRNILFSNEVKSYSSLCIIFSENINKAFKGIEFKDNLTYIVPKEENFEEEKLIAEDSINN